MNPMFTLPLSEGTLEIVGGKGASLAHLIRAGMPVPDGFHITTAAYQQFVRENNLSEHIQAALAKVDVSQPGTLESAAQAIGHAFARASTPSDITAAIARAYSDLGSTVAVAVRSSATAEDLPGLSFAGQQETWLNVRGIDALQQAVKRCWASLWTARAIGYRARHDIEQNAVSLAVVVQAMVPAEISGIMFTANPISGRHDEVMINAAWGLGEAIVSGSVSPDTIVVDKATRQVKGVEIGDKAVMTVPTPDGTADRPVAASRRTVQVLGDAQIAELVCLGQKIEAFYGTPQDIEWCWAKGEDGENAFFVVQSRPITTLGEPVLPVIPSPTEWKGPNPRARYLRNNIVELIPDPMTALFGTLGRRVINASLNRLMTAFLGMPGLIPEELIVTVQGYAYYNGALTPMQIGQILLNSIGIAKRMFTGSEARWRDAHARYIDTIEAWQQQLWRKSPATAVLDGACQVLDVAIAYYGALVSGVIPAAWISEGLFAAIYDRLVKRQGDPLAVTYLLGFDNVPILAEKALHDLAQWAGTRAGLAAFLARTPASHLSAQRDLPPGVDRDDWHEWQIRFQSYLEQYGATIYDLDFAKPTPADDPTPVLETFKLFLQGQGSNPHVRQQTSTQRRAQATQAMRARLKGWRLRAFDRSLKRAQKYAPQREDGLAHVGLGYPLIRRMLLEVGHRLVQAGAIQEADDVFWLPEDLVTATAAALDRGAPIARMMDEVQQNRTLWQAQKQITPPVSLPLLPEFLRRLLPASMGGQMETGQAAGDRGRTMRGTACSPGIVTGTARVMHGPEDFGQMRPGDVLVAAITTPAWTPLFAMASAIVTDIGGPLSHGSIVAREYGIPAVLGTGIATRSIQTGDLVRVDGRQGSVQIL